jgi:ubiquitin-conjugating enzyme E2 A
VRARARAFFQRAASPERPPARPPPDRRAAREEKIKKVMSSPSAAMLRLLSDLRSIKNDPPEGCSASPQSEDNLYVWSASICGPADSPWEGGIFALRVAFADSYPAKPPAVRFVSEVFHPNIYRDGSVCLDILQDRWSPVHSVATILTSLRSLLSDPNLASPANPEAAALLQSDPAAYNKKVRRLAQRSLE